MKIVLGVPEFPPYHIGGGGIVFEALANEYTKLGHEVMVVYGYYKTHHGFENIIEYTENNIQFVQVPLLPTPGFVPFLKTVLPTGLRNLSKIHKIIKQFNPDKVHLHGYGLLFINQLAKIIWSLKIPYIYTLHGAPVSADRKGGIIGKIYNLYKKTWGKAILDHASDITAVSQYTIDNFTEFHPYKNRIRVIPNGIYPEEYSKKIDYNYYDKLMGLSNNNESKSISKGNVSSVYIDENLHESIIGGLLVESPYIISEQIIKLRNKYSNYDEIRYSKLSSFNLPFYKAVIDYLTTINFTFYTMNFSTIKIFSYSDFVAKIAHNKNNLLVFLDYFSNSGGLYIEEVIYTHVKNVIFAIRQDSKSNYLIQITDLLLALYTRNINEVKSEPKKKLLQYFYKSGLSKRLQVLENNYIDKKKQATPSKTVGSLVNNNPSINKISGNASNSDKAIRFLSIGRIERRKGYDKFMRMIPYLVQEGIDVRYFIAGNDNGYKYKLEQLAIELGVSERIHYLGFISGDDKLSMLQNADYVIFPSEKETFGLVTLEAMASGVIPIINHIGGFTGIVQHGKNGIVINFDDVKQYKEIIENAIDKNIMIATVQKYNRQEIAKFYLVYF